MQPSPSSQRLTPLEAEALWRAWSVNADKAARDRLVLAYSPMVNYLASRKVRELPAHCELDDLASYGLIALIEAIDRFDPTKGASFEQYAWTRVSGAIMDELRRQDWASRSVRRTGRQIERAREAAYSRDGEAPTEEKLAAAVSLSVPELRNILAEVERADVVSLHAQARTTEEAATIEVIDMVASDARDTDPEQSLLADEKVELLRNAIANLTERERDVLALVHVHELPGAEIGNMFGVSESRISQILAGVRAKLRDQVQLYEAAAI
jgi:RNA polymerase sigma factor FliA